ncbi:hypothetical protein FPRO04_14054 [Fusarium proliferatum]|nr:hypothetical protein FPRO04_14054 [Fusarium proliferatum]
MASRTDSLSSTNCERDSALDVHETPGADIRRARKRATDRKSQRQHRERQKAYVRQLEDTVRFFKDKPGQSNDGEISELIKRQERLQARCHQLEAVLMRIRGLATIPDDGSRPLNKAAGEGMAQSPSTTQPLSPQDDLPNPPNNSQSLSGIGLSMQTQNREDVLQTGTSQKSNISFPENLDYLDLSQYFPLSPQESTFATYQGHDCEEVVIEDQSSHHTEQEVGLSGDSGQMDPSLEHCIDSIIDGTTVGLDIAPVSLLARVPGVTELITAQSQVSACDDAPRYLDFPKISKDLLSMWHALSKRAISQDSIDRAVDRRSGITPLSPHLLSWPTSASSSIIDILGAVSIFEGNTLTCPRPSAVITPIRTSAYLIYLDSGMSWRHELITSAFLSSCDQQTWKDLPWHEPLIIPQHCIETRVPDVRRTLVRDDNSLDPEYIGHELMRHMSVEWRPFDHVTGDLIGSTDIFAIIEAQACKWESWKVDKSSISKRNSSFSIFAINFFNLNTASRHFTMATIEEMSAYAEQLEAHTPPTSKNKHVTEIAIFKLLPEFSQNHGAVLAEFEANIVTNCSPGAQYAIGIRKIGWGFSEDDPATFVWLLDWEKIQDHWEFWKTQSFPPVIATISKLFEPGKPLVRHYDFGGAGMLDENIKIARITVRDDGNERKQQEPAKSLEGPSGKAKQVREGYAVDVNETNWWCSMVGYESMAEAKGDHVQIKNGDVAHVFELTYA